MKVFSIDLGGGLAYCGMTDDLEVIPLGYTMFDGTPGWDVAGDYSGILDKLIGHSVDSIEYLEFDAWDFPWDEFYDDPVKVWTQILVNR